MGTQVVLAELLLCLVASSAAPHANSVSVSHLEVRESRLVHELELQTLSVLEVLPELDLDGDGELSADELTRGAEPLRTYLDENYALFLGSPAVGPQTTRLANLVESAPADPASLFALQRIIAVRELDLDELPSALSIEVSVFSETSPDHRDFCSLDFAGQFEEEWLFSPEQALWEYRPDPELARDIFFAFAESGALELTRFEVLGLVLLLVLACPGIGPARRILLTLLLGLAAGAVGASAFGASIPTGILELTLLLAVPYVGVENLLQGKPRLPRIEAALFGLVLGATLVQRLTPNLAELPETSSALAGQAAGFLGAFLVLALVALLLLPRLPGQRAESGALAPTGLRRYGSLAFALIGLALFVQRAWFANG